jgi:glycosyltransferase involved in cell wall biosynthesis
MTKLSLHSAKAKADSDSNPAGRLVIGYLGRVLPVLSETFVVRELAALRNLGVVVKPFSLYPPDVTAVHPEAPTLANEVEVLARPQYVLFWLAHLSFATRYPARYLRCLWRYVIASGEPWRRRFRCLAHFMAAPFAARCLRRAGVSHLHAHFANTAASVAMMAAKLAGIPFSFTAHAYDIFVDDLLLPTKLSDAAFVVTCSHFNVRYLREHYPEATKARIAVVRYGIDPQVLTVKPHPQERPSLVLAVGRLVEKKGFHVLLAACETLRDLGVEAQFLIVGDGPEADRLRHMIAERQLADRVTLPGKLLPAALVEYYRRANLFVMPSCVADNDRDGIPNVLIEAMAMEVPVVSTRVSGIPELVCDGETGLLVEQNDPVGLAEAIARLLHDRQLARRLAKAGREVVLREFDINNSARTLLRLFRERRAPS